jgi:hypothetical protein
VTPRAAIVAPNVFGGLLRAIEDYQGAIETRTALELLALTFVRPGELRAAEWWNSISKPPFGKFPQAG